jgi:hypothetical protein
VLLSAYFSNIELRYKTFIHLVSAFVLFAAEDNLFQSVIGVLQFYLPHLSSTNWAGTAVGVFINMGFFFLTFVVNMSSQYLAECIRNQRHVLVKDIHKDTEPHAVVFESLQVLDIMKIKANEKTTMGSFALCGHGLVNMRLANGENKDKPFQSLLGNSKLEASAALASFCAKLKLGWVLSVWKEHSANLIIHEDAHEKMVLQPNHFLPAGTICLQDTYVPTLTPNSRTVPSLPSPNSCNRFSQPLCGTSAHRSYTKSPWLKDTAAFACRL